MTIIDRTAASDAEFVARFARFEPALAAVVAGDAAVERAARAMYDEDSDFEWDEEWPTCKNRYRRMARAAIAALSAVPPADEARELRERVEALADRWEKRGDDALLASRAPGANLGQHWQGMEIAAETKHYADELRAALSPLAAPDSSRSAERRGGR